MQYARQETGEDYYKVDGQHDSCMRLHQLDVAPEPGFTSVNLSFTSHTFYAGLSFLQSDIQLTWQILVGENTIYTPKAPSK